MSDITKMFKKLLRLLSDAEELADRIVAESEEDSARRCKSVPSPIVNSFRPGGRKRVFMNRLFRAAEPKAESLEIWRRADGSADVRVDGGKVFKLPSTLADLLSVLALDSGRSDDGVIGWKTFEETAVLLRGKTGRKPTRKALIQNIYRLRRELLVHGGADPMLVQTRRDCGVRFALRRGGLLKPAASSADQSTDGFAGEPADEFTPDDAEM